MLKPMTIGELARKSGVAISAIRYYEEQGLLRQADRLPNNRRCYGSETLEALALITACRGNNMSLESIRHLQRDVMDKGKKCAGAARLLNETVRNLSQQIALLQQARLHLSKAASACSVENCREGCAVPEHIVGM